MTVSKSEAVGSPTGRADRRIWVDCTRCLLTSGSQSDATRKVRASPRRRCRAGPRRPARRRAPAARSASTPRRCRRGPTARVAVEDAREHLAVGQELAGANDVGGIRGLQVERIARAVDVEFECQPGRLKPMAQPVAAVVPGQPLRQVRRGLKVTRASLRGRPSALPERRVKGRRPSASWRSRRSPRRASRCVRTGRRPAPGVRRQLAPADRAAGVAGAPAGGRGLPSQPGRAQHGGLGVPQVALVERATGPSSARQAPAAGGSGSCRRARRPCRSSRRGPRARASRRTGRRPTRCARRSRPARARGSRTADRAC